MKKSSEKFLIISIILFFAIGISIAHPIIFGYGVKFLDDSNFTHEIKAGQSKTIDISLRSYFQDKVLIDINVKYENPQTENFLQINSNEIKFDAPLSYFHTPKIPVIIQTINFDETEKTHIIILDLYANGKYMDTTFFEIKIME